MGKQKGFRKIQGVPKKNEKRVVNVSKLPANLQVGSNIKNIERLIEEEIEFAFWRKKMDKSFRKELKLLGAVDTRRKTGSGVNRKTTRREDRRIVRQTLVDPTVTHSTIRADVGVAIVPQTISRHLAEANLKSKRPFRALPLTSEHRQLRLQWCQSRSMWNVTDWQKVVFSDESRFVLGTDDNRVRVWRRPGERYNSPHTVLRHTAHTAGVMVWGS
ncbi:HTH_Tnp_Tc3_2 domain-containing protein [Trichonephila clavipes]|nr:HTH_Tnp_Tc3_2 domain-containing protein [Trichonephila clavipes]